jgi:hypothetical protein
MWVNKHIYAQLRDALQALKELGNYQSAEIQKRDRLIAQLHTQYATADGDRRAALVRADLMTVRVNQLQDERDQLFTKLMPDIKIATPRVAHAGAVLPPGISFEDLGDEQARLHGYGTDDMHDLHEAAGAITDDEQIDGLLGTTVPPKG